MLKERNLLCNSVSAKLHRRIHLIVCDVAPVDFRQAGGQIAQLQPTSIRCGSVFLNNLHKAVAVCRGLVKESSMRQKKNASSSDDSKVLKKPAACSTSHSRVRRMRRSTMANGGGKLDLVGTDRHVNGTLCNSQGKWE
eukprot:3902222-Rhodomonas_salina.2